MQINATFLIQIVNFWISYAMLHKLLFKPFVQLIEKKQAAQTKMLNVIKSKEQTIVHLQDDKKKNLEEFRVHLKETYHFTQPQLQDVPATCAIEKEQEGIDSITAQMKQLLIQKAPHAF
jgi:F0F1-type ATP synthase membrane subunit b/b'